MIVFIVIVLVLSVLIVAHELGHFTAARISDVRVEEFGIGMFKRLFSWKKGETEYSINALPIGGYVRLTGEDGSHTDDPRSFSNKPKRKRLFILSAGVIMNFVMAVVLFTIAYWIGMPEWGGQVVIKEIASGSPAEQSGLQTEDIILQAYGETVNSSEKLQEITKEHLGEKIKLDLRRGDQEISLEVLARTNPPEGQGAMGITMSLTPAIVDKTQYSFFRAPIEATKLAVTMTSEMSIGIGLIFKNLFVSGSVPDGVAGPIGIGVIVGELINFGIIPIVQFAGILSLNLAILNILPFPALDGGRIVFILIESVRRKKLSAKVEGWIHATGFIILLVLLVMVTYRDILRLFS